MTNEEIVEKCYYSGLVPSKQLLAAMNAAREDESGKWEAKLREERERATKLEEEIKKLQSLVSSIAELRIPYY